MKKIVWCLFLFLSFMMASATEYKILLSWDEFEGECNGFLSASFGNEHYFLDGANSKEILDGKIRSIGEGKSKEAKQSFIINSENGYFTFWIKDKFADDDLNADPTLIARSKPMISIYHNDNLIELIKIPDGEGLTCKVFTLDIGSASIDREIRYFPKSRIILGQVLNAVDGEPLSQAKISLTDYMGISKHFQTDSSGFFIFEAEIGEYKLSVAKEKFISSNFTVRMGADEMPRELICALSPEIEEFRIVLTWGSRPRDLDAHLSGPKPEGGNFHIWYRNRYPIGGKDFLDRDDMDKYGPETITIYKPAIGDYYYSVHDYSNRKQKRSKKLSFSGAIVQIYGENRLMKTYQIPLDQKGNCWHVFRINERQEIISVNEIEFVKNEKNIQ